MKLRWYGTASVMLESGSTKIVFDPFLGMPLTDEPVKRIKRECAFKSADAVLITHGHFDHIYDIPALYRNSDIKIYSTLTPRRTLMDRGVEENRLTLIAPGDKLELGPFKITAYQGRHCKFDAGVVFKTVFKSDALKNPHRLIRLLRLNSAYPENGETLFYEIEAEGKRIQLMGSMGMDPGAVYPNNAGVLILPFQGTGDPLSTVRPIVEALSPRAVFLDHYDDAFPPLSSAVRTSAFIREMTAKGIRALALRQGRVYDI